MVMNLLNSGTQPVVFEVHYGQEMSVYRVNP